MLGLAWSSPLQSSEWASFLYLDEFPEPVGTFEPEFCPTNPKCSFFLSWALIFSRGILPFCLDLISDFLFCSSVGLHRGIAEKTWRDHCRVCLLMTTSCVALVPCASDRSLCPWPRCGLMLCPICVWYRHGGGAAGSWGCPEGDCGELQVL